MKKIISAMCALAICLSMGAYSAELSYKQAILPIYDEAKVYSEGFAAVSKNGKWGYIDKSGKELTGFIYDYCGSFSENKAIVGKLKDKEDVTENGIIRSKLTMEMYIVDTKGREKPFTIEGKSFRSLDFNTSADLTFYGGIVKIISDKVPYYFKADGSLFPFTPKYIPTDGKMIFWNENDSSAGINVTDMSGNILFHMSGQANKNGYRTTRIYPFNQGVALADIAKFSSSGEVLEYGYGFINEKGKFITQPYYRDFYRSGTNSYKIFNDYGLASIMKDGKYGAVDKSGNVRIPFVYDKLFTFQEGLAPFMLNGKWGVMDIYGNITVSPKYTSITRFNGGLAIAHDGERAVLIDAKGNEVKAVTNIDLSEYVSVTTSPDGTRLVSSNPPGDMLIVKENGKYGYMKIDFKPTLPTSAEVDAWALKEVTSAVNDGLVPNELQNMYKENITREDFAHMVCAVLEKTMGKPIDEIVLEKTGKDMDSFINEYPFNDAFDKTIIGPYALNLIYGVGNGKFMPNENITRQDAAVMLTRLAKFFSKADKAEAVLALADFEYVAEYAKESTKFVQSLGIMYGTGQDRFSPLGYYTRQQAILTIYRLTKLA